MALDLIKLAILTDDDFAILLAAEHLESKTKSKVKFNFEDYDAARCKNDFRFFKHDILRLKSALGIPDWMKTKHGLLFPGTEGLCILLRRLAYPNRLVDLQLMFDRAVPELSAIFNCMIDKIHVNFGHLLVDINQWWMEKEHLNLYAEAIKKKGCPLDGCFGFIDGTILKTCRPSKYQRELYSGHKRCHGLKYQSLVIPNGLIANLHGPEPGRRHDSFMLKESGILEKIEEKIGADLLFLYGDSGYPLRKHLIVPFQGANLTPEQKVFNESMSKIRIAVEWEFGELYEQFAFLRYKFNQKVFLQPVAKYMSVGAILKNCQACLYGCQTSMYFDLAPPALEAYLHNNFMGNQL